ncbi:hypothetical protein BDI4_870048 [Burkholderia diffusa]|uniref:hypothetical protein n=1 Tax=Burkholderia diffusa TaxID=488732 RepID=UPI001CB0B9DA|nr:hypothetical protein [Burkholderia diffusa]CAG9265251.1 hypothetical protein BDI4_870048 [Burkholderia diffusa]
MQARYRHDDVHVLDGAAFSVLNHFHAFSIAEANAVCRCVAGANFEKPVLDVECLYSGA